MTFGWRENELQHCNAATLEKRLWVSVFSAEKPIAGDMAPPKPLPSPSQAAPKPLPTNPNLIGYSRDGEGHKKRRSRVLNDK